MNPESQNYVQVLVQLSKPAFLAPAIGTWPPAQDIRALGQSRPPASSGFRVEG